MEKGKKVQIVLLVILAIITVSLIIVYNQREREFKENNYVLVNNASTFFTIDGCANKYISALSLNNKDNVMKLLDSKYIRDNNITIDNVFEKLDFKEGYYVFSSKKIYQVDLSDEYIKYYIYGLLQRDALDEYDYGSGYYLIVNVDKNLNTFSITPYDGDIFKGGLQ